MFPMLAHWLIVSALAGAQDAPAAMQDATQPAAKTAPQEKPAAKGGEQPPEAPAEKPAAKPQEKAGATPPPPTPKPPRATTTDDAAVAPFSLPITSAGGKRAPLQVLAPKPTDLEKVQQPGIWTFDHFAFLPPRLITVNVPAKGRRLLWYLVYRVGNQSEENRFFSPDFVLVTDTGKTYRDVIMPKAQRTIQERTDPLQPLENSVTIVGDIAPSKEEGIDKSVYGVAIWDGVDSKTDAFSIFVGGLSNGFKTVEEADRKKKVLRKTLELMFARPSDEIDENSREIQYIGQRWVYR